MSAGFAACVAEAQSPVAGICDGSIRPWVAVGFGGSYWTAPLRLSVLEDLAAGLSLKGIDTCVLGHAGKKAPLAVVQLDAGDEGRVSVGIDVYDALTEKRVIRELDLRNVTPDARSLALAAAADELLRASWAELAIVDAPPPSQPPPPQVERSLRRSLRPAKVGGRDMHWGAAAVLDYHAGGQLWLGADTFVTLWLTERVGFELGVGLREGKTVDATHGRIESHALASSGDLVIALLPRGDVLGLALDVGTQLASVSMQGSADPGARAKQGAAVDLHARAGLLLTAAPLAWLGLRARLCGGVPMHSVAAADDRRTITSTSGPALYGGLGAELRF